MLVVVTGASGHIGANIVRELLIQGYRVRALVHSSKRALENLDLELVEGDINSVNSLTRAFAGADFVIHAAGFVSIQENEWDELYRVNVVATENVVKACKACKVKRLVHFSSIEAFDRSDMSLPVDEAFPLVSEGNASPYAYSKMLSEKIIRDEIEKGFDAVILNPTSIIGPFDFKKGKVTQALIDLCKGKYPILVQGEADWVDVRDVAQAAITALTKAPAGSRYLISGTRVDLESLSGMIDALLVKPRNRIYLPIWLVRLFLPLASFYFTALGKESLITTASLDALAGNWQISHSKAQFGLDYHPRPFADTMKETVSWLKQTGLI